MSSKMDNTTAVSVVIAPPSVDFDEKAYERIVDNILSDEASYEGLHGNLMMDGSIDSGSGSSSVYSGDTGEGFEETESPYFAEEKTSKLHVRPQRSITMIDVQNDGADEESVHEDSLRDKREDDVDGTLANPIAIDDKAVDTHLPIEDDITEEDIVFASVGSDQRDDLMAFLCSHPFMRNGERPVKRSARRQFQDEMQKEAATAGMDDTAIKRLLRYVKKTYCELYEISYTDLDGSEFGDEIDEDDGDEQRENKAKKERKRKRANSENSNGNMKKGKNGALHEVSVLAQSDDNESIMETPDESPQESSLDDESAISNGLYSVAMSTSQNSEDSKVPEIAEPAAKINTSTGNTGEADNFGGIHVDAQDLIILDNNNENAEIQELPFHNSEVMTDFESKSEQKHSVDSDKSLQPIYSGKKRERNHKKRVHRKERRASRYRESLGAIADGSVQQKDSRGVKELSKGKAKENKTQTDSVTASDEVQSKYFFCSPKKIKNSKIRFSEKHARKPDSPLVNHLEPEARTNRRNSDRQSIPTEARDILKDFDLTSDFLLSDSSLSDVPSNFDSDDERLSPLWSTQTSPAKDPIFIQPTAPRTPTKSTSPSKPPFPQLGKVPRLKLPKVSHYFPKPLVDPESCLPFPPIDAPSFGLVQEQLAHDPFRLLIATIFLNRTRGGVALPVLFKVFERYPTIEAMALADPSEFVSMIQCLGFQNQRAKKCIFIAQIWLTNPPIRGKRYRKLHYPQKLDGRDIRRDETIEDEDPRIAWEIAHLPGVGAYSLDSWRIFCRDELRGLAEDWKGCDAGTGFIPEWKSVLPLDKELRAYLTWMWLKEGWVWDRHTGERTLAGDKLMRAAKRGGVAHEEDGNWVLEMSPVKVANGL